jgi:hypothetical protein
MKCILCQVLTAGLLGLLINSGCSESPRFKVGGCISCIKKPAIRRVVSIGTYSFEVEDPKGELKIISFGDQEKFWTPTDCWFLFDALDKVNPKPSPLPRPTKSVCDYINTHTSEGKADKERCEKK